MSCCMFARASSQAQPAPFETQQLKQQSQVCSPAMLPNWEFLLTRAAASRSSQPHYLLAKPFTLCVPSAKRALPTVSLPSGKDMVPEQLSAVVHGFTWLLRTCTIL
eukprot:Amastigsp_a5126_9.p3 type:complete len:106 gc:universal Amastigsp_a5126_9:408-91(-)